MKKLITTLAVICLMLIVPFGFVACKNDMVVKSYEIINVENQVDIYGDIDLSNAKLRLTMSDGSVSEITIKQSMVVVPDLTTTGEKVLVVKYGKNLYEFKITVNNPYSGDGEVNAATVVSYEFLNAKTIYSLGEEFSIDNLKLKLKFNNDIVRTINVTREMISNVDMSYGGEKKVVVNFEGGQYEFKITVIDVRVQEFINKFLTYHGLKNGIEIPMAMYDYYDDISKFLHERDIVDCLEDSNEIDVIKYAKAIIKNIDDYSVAFREQSDITK